MAYQTGRNIAVSYKAQTTPGTLPGASGAKTFRASGGMIGMTKEAIRSNENRRDGLMTRGRHGSRSVSGQYTADLSLGSFDDLIAAGFRGTFDAGLTITQATAGLTSITTSANTIIAAAGSWITAGLRVGDVIRLTGHSTAGNNSRNLRITGLTATVITVAETITADAVADTTFSISRPKKVIQGPPSAAPAFCFEEYEVDLDASEVFDFCRVSSLRFELQPNGLLILTAGLVGIDMQVLEAASAPYFTSPTTTVSIGMTAAEAVLRLGTTDLVDVTAFDLTIDLSAAGQAVVGSPKSPDVFTNLSGVEASITALRGDLNRVKNFLAEDQLSFHLLATENEVEPKDFVSLFVPTLTLSGATKSELGADGPRTQALPFMVGAMDAGGAYDPTMVAFETSAP